MGAAFFYHLTQAPLAVTLASLSEKSLAAGWRVEVRGARTRCLRRLIPRFGRATGFYHMVWRMGRMTPISLFC